MDIQMPHLDGYAACERIRQIPRLKDLPIIGLTAHAMSEARERAIAVGMNAFVTKPFRSADLMSALQNLGNRATPADQPGEPLTKTEVVLPTVDLDGLRAEWQASGIIDKMQDIVTTFIEESNMELSRLDEAFGRKDLAAVAKIAHKMKSSVAALRVRRLEKLLQAIETAASGRSDSNENLHQLMVDALREWDAVQKVFEDARTGQDQHSS